MSFGKGNDVRVQDSSDAVVAGRDIHQLLSKLEINVVNNEFDVEILRSLVVDLGGHFASFIETMAELRARNAQLEADNTVLLNMLQQQLDQVRNRNNAS